MSVGAVEDHFTLYPEKFSTIGYCSFGYFSGWPILGRNRGVLERSGQGPGRRFTNRKIQWRAFKREKPGYEPGLRVVASLRVSSQIEKPFSRKNRSSRSRKAPRSIFSASSRIESFAFAL